MYFSLLLKGQQSTRTSLSVVILPDAFARGIHRLCDCPFLALHFTDKQALSTTHFRMTGSGPRGACVFTEHLHYKNRESIKTERSTQAAASKADPFPDHQALPEA